MNTLILFSCAFLQVLICEPFLERRLQSFQTNDSLPIPKEIPDLLFYLQRDPDSNTVCYTLNLNSEGQLNIKEPVRFFWVRYAENGERKELNYLQRKFAYGIIVKSLGHEIFEIKSVAYPQRILYLKKNNEKKYKVIASINGKECTLQRLFIRIRGGSPISPKIEYIELKGIDYLTGMIISERVKVSD